MTADRDRAAGGRTVPTDPPRDKTLAETAHEQVATGTPLAGKPLKRSRLVDKLFLAHRFATGFPQPQSREKRRADPTEGNASRRSRVKRPAKIKRLLSKKN